jgi:hypothetical protein
MAGPLHNPHNPPALVQPADGGLASPRQDRTIHIDQDTDLTLHGLSPNLSTGEVGLGGISARAIGRDLFRAAQVPLVDPSTNRIAEPASMYRQQMQQTYFTQSDLQRHMEQLGIDRAELFVAFKPGQEYVGLTTYGEFVNQKFEANRSGLSYALDGQAIRDMTNFITNGQGEFSSVRMWTDGRELLFAPSYTFSGIAPGVSTTLSGNVGAIMNSTRGLRPEYEHMLSGDPNDPTAGVPLGNGRFTYNLFRMADSAVTTFDFRGESIESSLYVGTGFNGYNFVAFRGLGDLLGGRAQADALFAQSLSGGSGVGGTLSFSTVVDPMLLKFSVEGYKQFEAPTGGFDGGVGNALGLTPGTGEYGLFFGLEMQRRSR